MIGIRGSRGVGKTTFLLQYAKENYGSSRSCLYINMNNFYFCGHRLADFAGEFYQSGGKVLLIDQIFKYPNWSAELRECYDRFSGLKVVFTVSSVMDLSEDKVIGDIVKSYELFGFSFREFLNLSTANNFGCYTLEDILEHHVQIASNLTHYISPMDFFQNYLHHGYYPFFLEKKNFSENLLKVMNMMVEVDVLLIKQIELKYLAKIKKLLYLLAMCCNASPNISQLAEDVQTSRATIMNYIKYLTDASLINLVYPEGEVHPKKPSCVLLGNPNLAYAISPHTALCELIPEMLLYNVLGREHTLRKTKRNHIFSLDGKYEFNIGGTKPPSRKYASRKNYFNIVNVEKGDGNAIPLWLFGFLY